jgi:hypothetical protein
MERMSDIPHDVAAECQRLVIGFAWCVDHFEDDAALDLFTHDTVIEQPGRALSGREGVAQMLAARPRSRATRHIISNCVVRLVSNTEAQCDSYITLLAREVQQTEFKVALVADCRDRIVRTDNGWRIAHRIVRPILPIQ